MPVATILVGLIMRSITSCTVLFTAFLASPANADWQYTRWGMTPEQVASASGGTVTIGPGEPSQEYSGARIGASGRYSTGDYQFNSQFHFADLKLVSVRLKLTGVDLRGDGYKLKNSLDGAYGKPFSESSGLMSIITYHDKEKNNRIDLVIIGNRMTTLEYRPLRDANSPGL